MFIFLASLQFEGRSREGEKRLKFQVLRHCGWIRQYGCIQISPVRDYNAAGIEKIIGGYVDASRKKQEVVQALADVTV